MNLLKLDLGVCSVAKSYPALWPHGQYPARLLCPWDSQASILSGLPFPPSGDLPNPGLERSVSYITTEPPGKPGTESTSGQSNRRKELAEPLLLYCYPWCHFLCCCRFHCHRNATLLLTWGYEKQKIFLPQGPHSQPSGPRERTFHVL